MPPFCLYDLFPYHTFLWSCNAIHFIVVLILLNHDNEQRKLLTGFRVGPASQFVAVTLLHRVYQYLHIQLSLKETQNNNKLDLRLIGCARKTTSIIIIGFYWFWKCKHFWKILCHPNHFWNALFVWVWQSKNRSLKQDIKCCIHLLYITLWMFYTAKLTNKIVTP